MLRHLNKWHVAALWLLSYLLMLATLLVQIYYQSVTLDADILNLLDNDQDAMQLVKQASRPFQQKALLLVAHHEPAQSKTYIDTISPQLMAVKGVSSVTANLADNLDLTEILAAYSSYPLNFLSAPAQQGKDNNDYAYLQQRYLQLMSQPGNPVVSGTLADAPLLNVADWIIEQSKQGSWMQDGNYLYATHAELRYYPLFIELTPGAMQLDQAVTTVDNIQRILLAANQAEQFTLKTSGYIFHGAAVTARAEYEMQLFGLISLIGIVLLTVLSFKSVRPLFMTLLLITGAVTAGLTVLVLVFDKIHLLALVFAISFIGVAVDYAYHILLSARHTGKTGGALARYMLPSLLMSGGTTLVSYLLLWFIPIGFLHQVAVFVSAGLAFAIFTGLSLLCWFPTVTHAPSEAVVKIVPKRYFVGVTVIFVGIIAIAGTMFRFVDDIRIFNSVPQDLIENERFVNNLIGNQQYPRFILLQGDSEEQLLQKFETTRSAFSSISNERLVGIDQWLPSGKRQQDNALWLRSALQLQLLPLISPFIRPQQLQKLLNSPIKVMQVAQLPQSINQLYPQILTQGTQKYGVLSYFAPLSESQLARLQQTLPFKVQLIDQPSQLSAALSELRHYLGYFLLASTLALMSLMLLRYGLRYGAVMLSIPLLAAGLALAVSQLHSGFLTLFNLLPCILILALNVDYSVFLKEHGRQRHVVHAIALAALTSMLAFGMLVLSNTPAIKQFGLTTLVGVAAGWLLCYLLPPSFLNKENHASKL